MWYSVYSVREGANEPVRVNKVETNNLHYGYAAGFNTTGPMGVISRGPLTNRSGHRAAAARMVA
jgi:hypothetical protein